MVENFEQMVESFEKEIGIFEEIKPKMRSDPFRKLQIRLPKNG